MSMYPMLDVVYSNMLHKYYGAYILEPVFQAYPNLGGFDVVTIEGKLVYEMPSTPTTGVHFTREDIRTILTSLNPPLELESYEGTELGFNNRIYFVSTTGGLDLVLKAGGKHWKRQKTEAEVAGLLAVSRVCGGDLAVPRILGFSSRISGAVVPWEWVLLEKLPGENMTVVWDALDEGQKEDIAHKLGEILVHMQSVTPAVLGIQDTHPQYGNLSLTRPEDDATAPGHDHTSVDISPSSSQPLFVSHILNGPPPSDTYLAYAQTQLLSAIKLLESPAQCMRFAYQPNVARLPRLRRFVERLSTEPPPLLRVMDASPCLRPVFTHGDLQPQNILIDAERAVSVLDWEWSGFFPPTIEWDAGLKELVALLESSESGRAKYVFMKVIHEAGIGAPWSAPSANSAEWEAAMKLMRLTECVVPWWLNGYPDNGGATDEEHKELSTRRDKAVTELDELLGFFEY